MRRDDVLVAPTIREHGIYGTEIGAFLERRLRVGSTFVDVGANLGWFSVLASSRVGERGRVSPSSPIPANLPLLRANLWGNRCDNATVIGVAAWSEPAHLDLVTYPEGGAATEVRSGGDGAVLVPAAPLDELIPGTVDVLKIDAQMTDHLAVRGAERIIAASPRIAVIAEFFPAALRDKGEDPERILDYYLGLGLELGMLDREGRGEIEPKTPAEIFAACENPEIPFVDVVLSKV